MDKQKILRISDRISLSLLVVAFGLYLDRQGPAEPSARENNARIMAELGEPFAEIEEDPFVQRLKRGENIQAEEAAESIKGFLERSAGKTDVIPDHLYDADAQAQTGAEIVSFVETADAEGWQAFSSPNASEQDIVERCLKRIRAKGDADTRKVRQIDPASVRVARHSREMFAIGVSPRGQHALDPGNMFLFNASSCKYVVPLGLRPTARIMLQHTVRPGEGRYLQTSAVSDELTAYAAHINPALEQISYVTWEPDLRVAYMFDAEASSLDRCLAPFEQHLDLKLGEISLRHVRLDRLPPSRCVRLRPPADEAVFSLARLTMPVPGSRAASQGRRQLQQQLKGDVDLREYLELVQAGVGGYSIRSGKSSSLPRPYNSRLRIEAFDPL